GVKPENQLPVFVYARTVGWLAHTIEYLENNRILRPRAIYQGPIGLEYKPLESR
ncbi:MAG TPA: citrate synthase, partial [Pyrodictiaceae archaeon]|nr:citrate synthase [Pyrodictiaceae archaeon]